MEADATVGFGRDGKVRMGKDGKCLRDVLVDGPSWEFGVSSAELGELTQG